MINAIHLHAVPEWLFVATAIVVVLRIALEWWSRRVTPGGERRC